MNRPLWQVEQAPRFSAAANFPLEHIVQALSLAVVPFVDTNVPALQLRHFEQAAVLSSEENFPCSHAAQVLSVVADPFAVT